MWERGKECEEDTRPLPTTHLLHRMPGTRILFLPYRPAARRQFTTTTLNYSARHKHHLPSPKRLLSLGGSTFGRLPYDGAACAGQVGHGQLRSLHSALQLVLVLPVHGCSSRSHSFTGRTRQAIDRGRKMSVCGLRTTTPSQQFRVDSLVSVHAAREGEPLDYEFYPNCSESILQIAGGISCPMC